MRTSLVVALLPGFSHCGERYILLCNFFQIVYFVRIFYLLLIFSYQHVFWAPILSPQLLGRITFGKITLDFSDTRFCANLRGPGAYTQLLFSFPVGAFGTYSRPTFCAHHLW